MTREKEIKRRLFEISTSNFNNSVVDSSSYFAGFTDGAHWADEHPHWISVEDELPKIGKDVLVLREDGEMLVAHQYNEEIARWWSVDGFPLKNNITHWMPLPAPPKKG